VFVDALGTFEVHHGNTSTAFVNVLYLMDATFSPEEVRAREQQQNIIHCILVAIILNPFTLELLILLNRKAALFFL
jgi:hypothetical protein